MEARRSIKLTQESNTALAIGEIAQPGRFKIFATNPSDAKFVLEEFLLPKDSAVKTMTEPKGKRVASGPGIQNVTLAKTMLERAGAGVMSVTELPASTSPRLRPARSTAPTRSSRPARSAA